MTSRERAQMRLEQIEERLASQHPRAARDGELRALFEDLADIARYEAAGFCKCCADNECECDGESIGDAAAWRASLAAEVGAAPQ